MSPPYRAAPLTVLLPEHFRPPVIGVVGREALSEPFRFEVEFELPAHEPVPFHRLLGHDLTLLLRLEESPDRLINGVVEELEEDPSEKSFRRCRATLVPRFALLAHRHQSRVFQGKSVPEMLQAVLEELDVAYELTGTYRPRNYCVQYRESNLAFASRLMEDEGIHYYFRHREDGHQMVITDTASHLDLPGGSRIVFDPIEKEQRARVRHWESFQDIVPSRLTFWDYHHELPLQPVEASAALLESISVGTASQRLRAGFNAQLEVHDGPLGLAAHFDDIGPDGRDSFDGLKPLYDTAWEVARRRGEEAAVGALDITGRGDYATFRPGFTFTLEGHPGAAGRYYLTRVEHRVTQPPPRSDGTTEFRYDNEFACLPADLPFRPARRTPQPHIAGLHTAVVVGPREHVVHVDRHGRVRIQFRWGGESCWVRVAQVWAGKGWGACFWPRVGHEVAVAFEDGDPDRPVVVGSLYNADNRPPFTLPEGALISGIKSCSAFAEALSVRDFNSFFIYDAPGDEHVQIHSQHEETTTTEHDRLVRVGTDSLRTVGALGGGVASAPPPSPPSPPPQSSDIKSGDSESSPPKNSDVKPSDNKPNDSGWRSHLTASSSQVFGEWARNLEFTVGDAVTSVLGTLSRSVVGSHTQIFVNPLSLIGQLPGFIGAGLAGMLGNTEISIGQVTNLQYGSRIDIHHGLRIVQSDLPLSHLCTAGAFLVGSLAIGANVYCMGTANDGDYVPYGLMAGVLKGAAVGVLVGLETKLALAVAAKKKAELAEIHAFTGRDELTFADTQWKPETLFMLKSMTNEALKQARKAAESAKQALALAGQVANSSQKLTDIPPQGDVVALRARRCKVFSQGSVTLAAKQSVMIAPTGKKTGEHGGHISMSGASVALNAGDSHIRLHESGSVDFLAGAEGFVHVSDGEKQPTGWLVTPNAVTIGYEARIPTQAVKITLDPNKVLLQYANEALIEISDLRIRLVFGNNSVTLSTAGVKIEGTKITIDAKIVKEESPLNEESYSGIQEIESSLTKEN
jgi:type VI secretion system secreted protein VgrG